MGAVEQLGFEYVTIEQITAIGTPLAVIVAYVLTKLENKSTARNVEQQLAQSTKERDHQLSSIQTQQSVMAIQQTMIHDLVNSNMQEMKRLYSVSMSRIATLTGLTSDKMEAIDAMQAYDTHVKKQAFIDERSKAAAL